MLEEVLTRIAVSLELIAAQVPVAEAPKKGKKTAEVAPEPDLLAAEKVITIDELRTALQGYMKVNGQDKTKALMIKHGANAAKPVLTTIPEKNYAAIILEIGV